jgi:hypothetical protein
MIERRRRTCDDTGDLIDERRVSGRGIPPGYSPLSGPNVGVAVAVPQFVDKRLVENPSRTGRTHISGTRGVCLCPCPTLSTSVRPISGICLELCFLSRPGEPRTGARSTGTSWLILWIVARDRSRWAVGDNQHAGDALASDSDPSTSHIATHPRQSNPLQPTAPTSA